MAAVGITERKLALVEARLGEHLADEVAVGVGEVRHRDADDPRGLQQPVLRQARVEKRLRPLGGLDVSLAEDPIVVLRDRRSERLQQAGEEFGLEARFLSYLRRAVAMRVLLEHPLDRQQHEPVLLDRLLQLLERNALVGELLQQRQPRLARLPLQVAEQALGLEIDLGHRPILESAGMAGLELPIFELPLVLLPGEQVPLHIFEERYKRMVGESLEQEEPFGIVLRDDEGARSIGCTARIDDVLERFDDGRMNIVVSGEAPFKVLDRFESPEYPTGEVELIPDEDVPPIDEEAASAAREAFAELAERATGERPEPGELDEASAYAIAARIELPADTKQRLLELRDEDERMTLLANALGAVGKALERAEEAAERASGNGKVHFPGLPE